MTELLKGLLKSWTAWLGAAIASAPDWWPLVLEEITRDAHPLDKHTELLIRLMGIAVILLRFKTTQSLQEKGQD